MTVTAEEITDHLRNLDSMDNLQRFFSDLNYDYDDSPTIPIDDSDLELASRPRIAATCGRFHVIYTRLLGDRLLAKYERPVVDRLLSHYPYALFVFSDEDASDWHFVNVKNEPEGRARRVHRRFFVGPDERRGDRLRTISEQLTGIQIPVSDMRRYYDDPLEIQDRHDKAFDVSEVTRKFYKQYREVFEHAERLIEGYEDADDLRLFTQQLFNRLMFIAFIQKKGWMNLDGDSDYLNDLWRAYSRDADSDNFYNTRLQLLFFNALDNPDERNYMQDDPAGNALRELIGEVPYLNGGLFEKTDEDKNPDVFVPDEAIKLILDNLFNRFNFTVTESTPLDVEVAIDPEMLGKVFEELVTGRHESGSYYTPKPIVSFMCREALKAHLGTTLNVETDEAIEYLVDDYNPERIRNPEATLQALQNVTACDPACGSGAYLLGMLHELLEIRRSLFNVKNVDPQTDYARKLEIIQKNLYGVDIDPFATNIAKLRLWLSLAVDFEGDEPEPLPNLDFKIETGDSLLAGAIRPEGIVIDTGDVVSGHSRTQADRLDFRTALIERSRELKGEYLTSHGKDKERLYGEIINIQASIRDLAKNRNVARNVLDWPVEFAEVFANGGFDIVLANPPYVRQELIKEIKPDLKKVFGSLYVGTADLYVFFYYRALEILKPGGALAFISSNKWFRANYGKKLRQHIADTGSVISITDFGDLPVFESATAYPMIFLAQREVNERKTVFTKVETLEPPYPDVKDIAQQFGNYLPPDAIQGERWLLTDEKTVNLILRMETDTVPLGKYVDGQIYRGVLTGFNTAFVIDGPKRAELIAADPNSAKIIKPLATGRDIRRWTIKDSDRWLIFTRRGINITRYPAIKDHLAQWKKDLTPKKRGEPSSAPGRKPGSYKWYEIQDNIAYYREFDKPKIMFPDITAESQFAYDNSARYVANTAYIIPVDDLYLVAILNSASVHRWYSEVSTEIRGGYLRFIRQYLVKIPIPQSSKAEQTTLTDFVLNCIESSRLGTPINEYEAEINERVARLYGVPANIAV